MLDATTWRYHHHENNFHHFTAWILPNHLASPPLSNSQTAVFADMDPINALPRLGGIVTHLCRECPVTAPAELQPLHVPPPPPPASSSTPSTPSPPSVPPGACGSTSGAQVAGGGVGGGGGAAGGDVDGAVVRRVRCAPWLPATLVDLAMALYGTKVGASVRMVSGGGVGRHRVQGVSSTV